MYRDASAIMAHPLEAIDSECAHHNCIIIHAMNVGHLTLTAQNCHLEGAARTALDYTEATMAFMLSK